MLFAASNAKTTGNNAMKSGQTLNIVFCIDDNFAVHLAALIKSIQVHNNSKNAFCFHIFSAELSKQNQDKLTHTAGNENLVKFYQIDSHHFDNAQVSQYFSNRMSVVTYFRVLVPEMLSSVNSKAVFMDADMIVNADIAPLFTLDLQGAVAGVVEDSSIAKTDYWHTLGLDKPLYFNAGLMLIDLPAWRQQHITDAAMKRVNSGKAYKFNDQDILNVVLKNHVKFIDRGWNIQHRCVVDDIPDTTAKIIHYNGAEKPWHFACIHPYADLYLKFKALTPYAETALTHFIDEHDRQLTELITQSKTTQIYIYGAGQKGRRIACYLQSEKPEVNIVGLIDKKPQMSQFCGIPVSASVPKLGNEYVVVASSAYADEIVEHLKNNNVPGDSIIAAETR